MDKLRSFWKDIRETADVSRIASAYIWSNIFHYPEGERHQIDQDTFIKVLCSPEKAIGNILILQGGIRHMDSNSYYIRTAAMFVSRNIRVILFEKLQPVVNLDFSHNVAHALSYIKEHFPGPLCVIGYSMGGVLLYSYLGEGYDQADLYIPACCPLDLRRFEKIISDHAIFRFVQNRSLQSFGVTGKKELFELAGTSVEEHDDQIEKFIPSINRHTDKWLSKTIYVVSSDDPITGNCNDNLKLLKKAPLTYVVNKGWHCCLDSTLLTIILACNYIKAVNTNTYKNLETIPYF